MNFTVCLIAKNESKTLPRLMESLREFQQRGGRVLLLDTGSTDGTAEVARNLGCEVHEVGEKFIRTIDDQTAQKINELFVVEGEAPIVKGGDRLFDYASARNYIAEFSPTDMVAMPDCDEIYTKLDLDKVNQLIESGIEQLEYNFVFAHHPDGSEALKFMHCKFYNRKKLQWHRITHEVLQGAANRQFVGEDVIKLEHFQNVETNRSGYIRGMALDCFEDPNSDRNWHYLGRELLWTGRFKSAIKVLKQHIKMQAWPTEQSQSMVFLGEACMHLGKEDEAISWWTQAINLEPNRREPYMKLAEHYWKKNVPQTAACYALAALQIPDNNFYANNQDHYKHLPHEILYWALYYLDRKDESQHHWLKCIGYQPNNEKFLHDSRYYFELPKVTFVIPHMGQSERRIQGLQKCLDSIDELNYPKELIEKIVLVDTLEDRQGVPKRVKEGVEKSTGDVIVYASNDTVFTKNSLIQAVLISFLEGWGLVAFNTGEVSPDEGNICEHFLIWKWVIAKIGGEIFDTEFHHVGVDNLLWAKCQKLQVATRCDDAVVIHDHFARTGGPMDDVYTLGWSEKEHDRELLKQKLEQLNSK